jgi:hypothetical protein
MGRDGGGGLAEGGVGYVGVVVHGCKL